MQQGEGNNSDGDHAEGAPVSTKRGLDADQRAEGHDEGQTEVRCGEQEPESYHLNRRLSRQGRSNSDALEDWDEKEREPTRADGEDEGEPAPASTGEERRHEDVERSDEEHAGDVLRRGEYGKVRKARRGCELPQRDVEREHEGRMVGLGRRGVVNKPGCRPLALQHGRPVRAEILVVPVVSEVDPVGWSCQALDGRWNLREKQDNRADEQQRLPFGTSDRGKKRGGPVWCDRAGRARVPGFRRPRPWRSRVRNRRHSRATLGGGIRAGG